MAIDSYRDLQVWQGGMDLVEYVYRLTSRLPRHELYGLIGQLRRAVISIPSNIAEGHARNHLREYLQHLAVAQGSIAELETQFEIAKRLDYISAADLDRVLTQSTMSGRQLRALRQALTKKVNSSNPRRN